ncbi:MAG: hypothetical protein NUV59_03305, partial [Patescibacteria group bacterium]|nr:hypothetical protein [Patescibacteria group bacterium]
MSIARVGVLCAALLAGSILAFASMAHALGANVPTNQTPTTESTKQKQYTSSKSPASCNVAKTRALGYPSDGEVTSINAESQSGILDSCIGAVLKEGADMTSVDDYQCVGRSGKVYIVTGTFLSKGSIEITTSPDKTLAAGECRISVCNGARGTVKVCKEPQLYKNGVSALSAGGIANGPSPVVTIGAQPDTSTQSSQATTLEQGSSIIGQAFGPSPLTSQTPIAEQGGLMSASQGIGNTFGQVPTPTGLTPGLLSQEISSGNPVQLEGGLLSDSQNPALATREVQTTQITGGGTAGGETFQAGEIKVGNDFNKAGEESACSGISCWTNIDVKTAVFGAIPAVASGARAALVAGEVSAFNPLIMGGGLVVGATCYYFCPDAVDKL